MMLPFLKKRKLPKVATEPIEEKLVNGSADDLMEEQLTKEFLESLESKDIKTFRNALESLIIQMFDYDQDEGEDDATHSRT